MSVQVVSWVLQHAMVDDPADLAILVSIAVRADHDGGNAWPSLQTIAEEARISRSTAIRRLERLRARGILRDEGTHPHWTPSGSKRTVTYRIAMDLECHSRDTAAEDLECRSRDTAAEVSPVNLQVQIDRPEVSQLRHPNRPSGTVLTEEKTPSGLQKPSTHAPRAIAGTVNGSHAATGSGPGPTPILNVVPDVAKRLGVRAAEAGTPIQDADDPTAVVLQALREATGRPPTGDDIRQLEALQGAYSQCPWGSQDFAHRVARKIRKTDAHWRETRGEAYERPRSLAAFRPSLEVLLDHVEGVRVG